MSPARITLGVCLVALGACADKIGHDAPDANLAFDAATTGKVRTARAADGTYTTVIDATSMTDWIYVDFATGAEVDAAAAWDLRFQRFHISTNGGISGQGGVEVAPIANATFAAVTAAPATGFLVDTDDTDGNGIPDYAFDQGDRWYDYDVSSHVLSPRPTVWVVKTDGGAALKLEITKYYDDAGTAAWFTLHWGTL